MYVYIVDKAKLETSNNFAAEPKEQMLVNVIKCCAILGCVLFVSW